MINKIFKHDRKDVEFFFIYIYIKRSPEQLIMTIALDIFCDGKIIFLFPDQYFNIYLSFI